MKREEVVAVFMEKILAMSLEWLITVEAEG